ncbi:hypothetical protein FJY93_02915 [Candidatus Kaiserbacteria bacterium]|nr:hypothetical protein [Candidatus Kaiserbacteria bacterium]
MDPNAKKLEEIARLARENNQILHGMRRSAFFWGFMKFLIYMVLFAAPIWFYLTYVSGTLDQMVTAINKMQGTAAQAEEKFDGFQSFLKDVRESLPSLPSMSASSSDEAR